MFFSTRANVKRAQAERVYDHQDLLTRQEERRVWMRYARRRWIDSLVGQSFPRTMLDLCLSFALLAFVCVVLFSFGAGLVGTYDWLTGR